MMPTTTQFIALFCWMLTTFFVGRFFERMATFFFRDMHQSCTDFVNEFQPHSKLTAFQWVPKPMSSRLFWISSMLGSAAIFFSPPNQDLFLLGLLVSLIAAQMLLLFDAAYLLLPDELVWLFGFGNLMMGMSQANSLMDIGMATLTMVALLLTLKGIFFLRGRDALGLGDVKLLVAMMPWTHLLTFYFVLFPACLFAIVYAVVFRMRAKATSSTPFPFGPALLSAWVAFPLSYHFFHSFFRFSLV
jgi:prepilin signal peptidase PulO-like enzyme (type II secretory pathway)